MFKIIFFQEMSSQDGIVTLGLDVPQLNVPRSMGIKTKKSRFKKKKIETRYSCQGTEIEQKQSSRQG